MSITMAQIEKDKMILIIVLALLMLFVLLTGCAVVDTGATVRPSMETEAELEATLKENKELKQSFSDVQGNIEILQEDKNTLINSNTTLNKQLSAVNNHNESLKSIMVTVALIVAGFFVLFFALYVIMAKVVPGKTLWNIICPWRMVKNTKGEKQ